MKSITLLGATGSIGASTLKLIARYPEKYRLFAATANSNVDKLYDIIQTFSPAIAVMVEEEAALTLRARLGTGHATEVLSGAAALTDVSALPEIDTVVAGIVGIAGLPSVIAAAKSGKRILLANKEALVVTGECLMQTVKAQGAMLLPTDSEHFALWECLPADYQFGQWHPDVARLVLTASGGPFRGKTQDELRAVTPAEAIAHPTWQMGPKISTDCATLVNKGLELIEACWLFGAKPNQIEVVVHPQSMIHSMVDYVDGQTLSHMGAADMCVPIGRGLSWPERLPTGVASLDWCSLGALTFEPPDHNTFPAIQLARRAFEAGGAYCLALNAANEVAVDAFLKGQISFPQITALIEQVLEADWSMPIDSLEVVLPLNEKAKILAARFV